MPLQALSAILSEGQKTAALKRFRARYTEELAAIEAEMQEIMTSLAEADYLVQFLGEQPEVVELRARRAELEVKDKRRQYLGKLLDRLDQCIPEQPAMNVPPPAGNVGSSSQKVPVRRY
jgi:hypothetical protein